MMNNIYEAIFVKYKFINRAKERTVLIMLYLTFMHTYTHRFLTPLIKLRIQIFLLNSSLSLRGFAFIRQQNQRDVSVYTFF